jgi:hypothetical protein
MNSKVVQIALRISLLKEEFSEAEITEAVKFLEEQGSASALLAFLAGRKTVDFTFEKKRSRHKSKPLKEYRSKAVLELEDNDPEKYQLLAEFDSLIREGKILPKLEDIKKLGERLSKDFAPKNSRREAISKLMSLIANRPVDEIGEIIRRTLSSAQFENQNSDYQELARFIISGKSAQQRAS